jgi:hypothetical protein
VRLVIISDHNRVRDLLGNQTILMILNSKYHLEPKLLVLMTTIARDPHWRINLHGTLWNEWIWTIPRSF